MASNNQPEYDFTLTAAWERLGNEMFEASWSRAQAMGLGRAVAEALEEIAAS